MISYEFPGSHLKGYAQETVAIDNRGGFRDSCFGWHFGNKFSLRNASEQKERGKEKCSSISITMQRRQIDALLRIVSARPPPATSSWDEAAGEEGGRRRTFTQSHNTKVVQKPTTHPTTGGGCSATQRKFTMQKESLLVNWAQTAALSCPVTNSTQRATARVLTVCEEQAPPQHMMMMMRAVWLLAAARGSYGGCSRCTGSV